MQPPPISEDSYGSGVYDADKVIGIILMILNACGAIGGLFLLGGAGVVGASGLNVQGKAVTAAGLGIMGVVVIAMSVLGIILGYGIMKSAKWGFIGGAVVFGISTVTNVLSLGDNGARGLLGVAIAAGGLIYCGMRLSGNLGPKPV